MKLKSLFLVAVAVLLIVPAALADTGTFSFTGNFTHDNDVQVFAFSVTGGTSNVTLLTYSYAGGTNAAGQNILRGGFDPILSLFDAATGLRIDFNDDGGCPPVSPDAVTHMCYDTYLNIPALANGNYFVAVSQYNNWAPAVWPGAFAHDGDPNFTAAYNPNCGGFADVTGNCRDGHWAFDVLGVQQANTVPEPASLALLGSGLLGLGGAIRRKLAR